MKLHELIALFGNNIDTEKQAILIKYNNGKNQYYTDTIKVRDINLYAESPLVNMLNKRVYKARINDNGELEAYID